MKPISASTEGTKETLAERLVRAAKYSEELEGKEMFKPIMAFSILQTSGHDSHVKDCALLADVFGATYPDSELCDRGPCSTLGLCFMAAMVEAGDA